MHGYAVSRDGTFGVVTRTYLTHDGKECAIIRWGGFGWLTPVLMSDVFKLDSCYESEARQQADTILAELEGK